jgi:hypothetical protein
MDLLFRERSPLAIVELDALCSTKGEISSLSKLVMENMKLRYRPPLPVGHRGGREAKPDTETCIAQTAWLEENCHR